MNMMNILGVFGFTFGLSACMIVILTARNTEEDIDIINNRINIIEKSITKESNISESIWKNMYDMTVSNVNLSNSYEELDKKVNTLMQKYTLGI